MAAGLKDPGLVAFEIEIEIGENVILDAARLITQVLEFRQPRRGLAAPGGETFAQARQRARAGQSSLPTSYADWP